MGYWGGKLSPKEKDLIRGMAAAKSLQALVAILRSPPPAPNVLNITMAEKQKSATKTSVSNLLFLTIWNNFFITKIQKQVYNRGR